MNNTELSLIFELSKEGRKSYSLPQLDVPFQGADSCLPERYLRKEAAALPELSELDVVRHFTRLSQRNHGVESGFYPLGSCTMKYNPKVNEYIANLSGFTSIHPYQSEDTIQGSLKLLYQLQKMLAEISGMEESTLMPAAGAHGEMTGLMIIKAYHQRRGDLKRTKIIVPDAAHGTNPASAHMAGFDIVEVKSNDEGGVDLEALKQLMNEEIAGLMLTNPNTLGIFEKNIMVISDIIHDAGGLLYYDGANMNAIMGITRPGDMGFDVVHLNLHKTFSTPHGGGGPGAGPLCVKKALADFLPKPVVKEKEGYYYFDYQLPHSIGKVKAFYGNYLVLVKAYSYILSMGDKGLREASQGAVLNANYLQNHLKEIFDQPFDRICMHECVLSGKKQKIDYGVSTLDIAKRLLDFGYHPPTIYFPLIVEEAMMFEPTESESKATLDEFISVMRTIAKEAEEDPELLLGAPHHAPVGRLNEAQAARSPVLKWPVIKK